MRKIAWSKIECSIAEEAVRVYEERTQAKLWTEIKKKLVYKFQVDNSATASEQN